MHVRVKAIPPPNCAKNAFDLPFIQSDATGDAITLASEVNTYQQRPKCKDLRYSYKICTTIESLKIEKT